MPGKFNYEVRHKYPHMIGEDSAVWSRFIMLHPARFDTVDYDVKVGSGSHTESIPEQKYSNYWSQLTKKRIDVIAHKDNFITIIEVKKRASLFTLGQILGYKFLFLRSNPDIKLVKTLILCSTISPDDILILDHYGVDFQVV